MVLARAFARRYPETSRGIAIIDPRNARFKNDNAGGTE
jgi:hypothetical protein